MARSEARVALVAGGSGGIGEAVSKTLARAGHAVYVGFHRGEEPAARVCREIAAEGRRAKSLRLNVLDTASADAACQAIFDREGRLDVLVNCAAINREAPAAAMDDATWREVVEANLDGAFRLCRAAIKFMMLGRWGRIVNISSVSAALGGRGQINYAVSKAGVEAMTRVLALEYGRKGVLVNCVAPGSIMTEGTKQLFYGPDGKFSDCVQAMLAHIPLGRPGTVEEIAHAVLFLVAPESSYINGAVLTVDGGWLAGYIREF